MYVTVAKTRLAGPAEQAVQRVREQIPPLLQGRPGLLGYCLFLGEPEDAACSVGIFEDRAAALDAQRRLRAWTEEAMRDLLPGEPETAAGETVFHDVARPQEQQGDSQRPLFVVLRSYTGLPGQTETMHSLVSERTLPAIMGAQGFRGFYAFRDEHDPDQAVSVTLFDNRAEAMRAHAAVLDIMRETLGDLAYAAPRVVAGETAVLVTG